MTVVIFIHHENKIPFLGPDARRMHKEWIPTEYDKLVSMMRKANLIKDNRVSLTKTYRNSFKGEDFVSWITRTKKIRKKGYLK